MLERQKKEVVFQELPVEKCYKCERSDNRLSFYTPDNEKMPLLTIEWDDANCEYFEISHDESKARQALELLCWLSQYARVDRKAVYSNF